jgi:hypothetical protein
VRFTFPLRVEPERGETKVTSGGVVSGAVPVLVPGVESEKVSRVREPILERAFHMVIEVAFAGAMTEAVRVSGIMVLFAGTVLRNWYWYVFPGSWNRA